MALAFSSWGHYEKNFGIHSLALGFESYLVGCNSSSNLPRPEQRQGSAEGGQERPKKGG
jgi:hypothetical protein